MSGIHQARLGSLEAAAVILESVVRTAYFEGKPYGWSPDEVVRAAIAEITELREEKARMDCLASHAGAFDHNEYSDYHYYWGGGNRPLREVVDEVRKQ